MRLQTYELHTVYYGGFNHGNTPKGAERDGENRLGKLMG